MKPQHILAIDTNIFRNMLGFHLEEAAVDNHDLVLMQREGLETNTAYRQLISYTIIRHDQKFLAYARTTSAGEARLHGQVSIGFGGHVDLEDCVHVDSVLDLEATALNAAHRELGEELTLGLTEGLRVTNKYIISMVTETDQVHAGALSIMDVIDEAATAKEDQIEILGWFTRDELLAQFADRLESWSYGLLEEGQAIYG
jgi:predicted NUDIX family phosphoesterase